MRLTRIWALCSLLLLPTAAEASTTLLNVPLNPKIGPFPSDLLTVADPRQKTGRQVNMPEAPACFDTDPDADFCMAVKQLLNQFDGFSVKPQITLCFSAAINPATLKGAVAMAPADGSAPALGIDQVFYDGIANCALAKPDNVLDQTTEYLLFVSNRVRDTAGNPVVADEAYKSCANGVGSTYCARLARALTKGPIEARQVPVVGASLFTTMSATDWLQKARNFLYAGPKPRRLDVGPKSVFNVSDVQSFVWLPQTNIFQPPSTPISIPVAVLDGVDRIAFGMYLSPNFLQTSGFAPGTIAVTPTGNPTVQNPIPVPGFSAPPGYEGYAPISYHLFLPHVTDPGTRIPVVIYGHGSGDSQFGAPTAIASTLAKAGFATLAMEVVGHGFGPESLTVLSESSGDFVVTSPGRGVPIPDGSGVIVPGFGCLVPGPIAVRDCLRQTAVDVMALVQNIRADGLGLNLDRDRIYYVGQSLGSLIGSLVQAVEPKVTKAVINVGGDSSVDAARLAYGPKRPFESPDLDYLVSYNSSLVIPLQNDPSNPLSGPKFDFFYPYRNRVSQVVTEPGKSVATDIQRAFEVADWINVPGAPLAFAPHFKAKPLPKVPPKATLFQFGWGDLEVANPVESNLVRAYAGPAQPTFATLPVQYFRYDLALAADPHLAFVFMEGAPFSILPHRYLANPSIGEPSNADELLLMLQVQQQVVRFLKFGTTSVLPLFFQNLSLATLPTTRHYTWPIQVNPSP